MKKRKNIFTKPKEEYEKNMNMKNMKKKERKKDLRRKILFVNYSDTIFLFEEQHIHFVLLFRSFKYSIQLFDHFKLQTLKNFFKKLSKKL